MTYYSALHYAAKAEKSATAAAEAADRASAVVSGKVTQLGFDGSISGVDLVFSHTPSGVEIPYVIEENKEYEIDLAFNGTLTSDIKFMYVKNGEDTIQFVSALHRTLDRVSLKEMQQVMRFNEDTGYRWLFKAVYKITTSGSKVFLLYPVVSASPNIPIQFIPQWSGTVPLESNKVYRITLHGDTVFKLPSIQDTSVVYQIKIMLYVKGPSTIDWGTENFFYGVTPDINGGLYDVYYDYDAELNGWVCGVLPKGA